MKIVQNNPFNDSPFPLQGKGLGMGSKKQRAQLIEKQIVNTLT
jgi:hypothetical protein